MAVLISGSADQKLISEWDQKLKSAQDARLNFEKQWHENLAFFNGRQWIISQRTASGFQLQEQKPSHSWRVRHTANRIKRIVRTELTKLSKEEPQFGCQPASTDERDRLAAMAGDAISDFIMRTKYFNKKRSMATFWALICGTSFLKNYYDENKLEMDGKPGKIDFDPVTAFHLFVPNLFATEIEEQPWVQQARCMSPEEVYNCYGIDIEPGTDTAHLLIDQRFLTSIGIKNAQSTENKQCYVKDVYVKPCKNFPNGAYFVHGEGKMLYVYERTEEPEPGELLVPPEELETSKIAPVGENPESTLFDVPEPKEVDTDLQDDDYIAPKGTEVNQYDHQYGYAHGRFPFAKIDHIPTGMFYAESVIPGLIPLQREYNRTRSSMLEWRNLAGKPQWWFTPGAIDPKLLNAQPGLHVPVPMGFDPPQPLPQPELSPSMANDLDLTIRDIDDYSVQGEIARGDTPPGVEAASAIAYLSEENDTVLFHTVQSLEAAVQETGVQVLANVHEWWDEQRIVKMTSRNQYLETREFKAQDLLPIMDFRVETGSMAPKSLAAKQAFITELVKMGYPLEKALRYLQMSETNKMYEEAMIDVRHAMRENVYMSKGQKLTKVDLDADPVPVAIDPMTQQPITQPANKTDMTHDPSTGQVMTDEAGQPIMYEVTVNPFDAHEIHVEEHQNYQKTQEYELLSDEIKKIIQEHVDEHKMEILKERNAIQADMAAKGETEETVPPRELEGAPSGNGSMPV